MQIFFYLTTVVLFGIQDTVKSVTPVSPRQVVVVSIGEPLLLNCTYNCSSGFIRGCWDTSPPALNCLIESKESILNGDICTLPWHVPNITMDHIGHDYICYTEETDHEHLPRMTRLNVSLQLQELNPETTPYSHSGTVKPKEEMGEFPTLNILATVIIVIVMVLGVLVVSLCLMKPKKGKSTACNTDSKKRHSVLPPVIGPSSRQPDRLNLRIPTTDHQSDTEVSYADIVITVRGASTPELSQIPYLSPGGNKRWRNEGLSSIPLAHLQASRSADRLHVLPREVSRKMSTSSEYAVITYS